MQVRKISENTKLKWGRLCVNSLMTSEVSVHSLSLLVHSELSPRLKSIVAEGACGIHHLMVVLRQGKDNTGSNQDKIQLPRVLPSILLLQRRPAPTSHFLPIRPSYYESIQGLICLSQNPQDPFSPWQPNRWLIFYLGLCIHTHESKEPGFLSISLQCIWKQSCTSLKK